MTLAPNDWTGILLPHQPIFESIARISIIYLSIFVLLRLILKREAGGTSTNDILVVVLIADLLQNGMVGHYTSVGDGLILACTLIFWDWLLDYLSFRSPTFAKLVKPRPVLIIREGQVIRKAAHRELLTIADIMQEVKLQGLDSIDKVKAAYVESNGQISVIPFEKMN